MINRILRGGALSVALISLSLGACKKDEKSAEPAPANVDPAPAKVDPKPEPEPAKVVEEEAGDYFYVEASHAEPKPEDPVNVSFPKVKVVKSSIDLAKKSA